MSDADARLIQCFAAVFPNLTHEQIPDASIENTPEWDSLATVTLVSVLDQEFATTIDIFDLPELKSFSAVQDYLKKHDVLA